MMKKFKALILSLIMVLSIGFSAACNKKSGTTLPDITLDVLTEDTAEIGFLYEIQTAYGVDDEGNLYTPVISVKVKDGGAVTVTDNKFTPAIKTDHIITFTITEGRQPVEKTCTVHIVDTTAPDIQISLPNNVRPGNTVTPVITFNDNSGSVKDSETKVLFKGSLEIELDGEGSFTAEKGYYVFEVSAEDNDGNKAQKSAEMAVIPSLSPYNDFASGESFEYGYDPQLITHVGASAVLTYDALGVTEGDFALKMEIPNNHGFTTLSPELLGRLASVYETVSFDFTNGGQNVHEIASRIKDLQNPDSNITSTIVNVEPGATVTYTIDKAMLLSITGAESYFTLVVVNDKPETKETPLIYYIDNIRGGFETRKVKVDETVDAGEVFNAIADKFSENDDLATIDTNSFTVTDSDGQIVSAGVNTANLTFTPKAKGNYTISATLSKQGYNDLTLEIPVYADLQNFITYDLSFEEMTATEKTGILDYIKPIISSATGYADVHRDVATGVTDGDVSLCFSTTGTVYYNMSIEFIKEMRKIYDTITFDVKVSGSGIRWCIGSPAGSGKNTDLTCVSGTSYVYTLNKTYLDAVIAANTDIQFVLVDDEGGYTRYCYIDNIRGGFETQNAIVDEQFNIESKLNAIAVNFDNAAFDDFRIEDSEGITVSTDMIFTPVTGGIYSIKVLLTKEGYNPLQILIPLEIELANFVPYDLSFEGMTATDKTGILDYIKPIISSATGYANLHRDTATGITDGNVSLCFSTTGTVYYYMSINFIKEMRKIYDTITFDVKVSGSGIRWCIGSPAGSGKNADLTCVSGTSYVYTLNKTYLDVVIAANTDIQFVLVDDVGGSTRYCYIDNIRGGFETQNVTIGETFNAGTKFNAIAAKFPGATLTGFTVKDSGGEPVTTGVDVDNLTFTPSVAGKHTVYVTLTKDGYYPYEIAILLDVPFYDFMTNYDLSFEGMTATDKTGILDYIKPIISSATGYANLHRDTATGVTDGGVSLCFSTTGTVKYNMSIEFIKEMRKIYDTITFDVKVSGSGIRWCIGSPVLAGKNADLTCVSGTSYVYTLNKTYLDAVITANTDIQFVLVDDVGGSTRYCYIDNIRGGFEMQNVTEGTEFDAATVLGAKATALGATLTGFTVKDSGGEPVTTGVDDDNLTFTPSVAGTYTIYVTLTKANYTPIELALPLSVSAAAG